MKYGFIGCGNMGGAIARALSNSTKDITLSDISGKDKILAAELGVSHADNASVAANCDRIFLAVKPHLMKGALAPLQEILAQKKPLLITMAAGLEIRQIEEFVGARLPIIRIMPNTIWILPFFSAEILPLPRFLPRSCQPAAGPGGLPRTFHTAEYTAFYLPYPWTDFFPV